MKQADKAAEQQAAAAESAEGRTPTKENISQAHTPPAQDGPRVSQGLAGVREVARARRQEQFTGLLHHLTIDLEAWRKKVASGAVMAVRYADDLVVGFEHRAEAKRFLREFQERLAKFGLELHPDKTRLIEFGRFARANRKAWGEGEPESFTFLGFTHQCGNNSRGNFVIWRRTARKRLEAKLRQVKQTLRERMHEPVPKVGEWLGRVLNGFYQYHAILGNWASLNRFRERIGRYWRQALTRRSQRGRQKADRMTRLFNRWLPRPRLLHPYPDVRFDATHPR
jgi:hypothetical protein